MPNDAPKRVGILREKHTIAMLTAFDRLKEALQGKRLKAARKFVNTCNGGPKLCSAEKTYPF